MALMNDPEQIFSIVLEELDDAIQVFKIMQAWVDQGVKEKLQHYIQLLTKYKNIFEKMDNADEKLSALSIELLVEVTAITNYLRLKGDSISLDFLYVLLPDLILKFASDEDLQKASVHGEISDVIQRIIKNRKEAESKKSANVDVSNQHEVITRSYPSSFNELIAIFIKVKQSVDDYIMEVENRIKQCTDKYDLSNIIKKINHIEYIKKIFYLNCERCSGRPSHYI